jgi:hypothetical protein
MEVFGFGTGDVGSGRFLGARGFGEWCNCTEIGVLLARLFGEVAAVSATG